MLNGYKVYIVAAVTVAFAAVQYWNGAIDMNSAVAMVLAALGASGLRKGMASETKLQLAAKNINVGSTTSVPARMDAIVKKVGPSLPALLATFLALSLMLSTLTACATPGVTPQMELNAVEAGFALAEASYDSICSRNQPPSFCADNATNYAKAKLAVEAAFQTAQAAIDLSGNVSTAGIVQLIGAAQNAWATFNVIVKSTETKARAVGMKVQAR